MIDKASCVKSVDMEQLFAESELIKMSWMLETTIIYGTTDIQGKF